MIDKICVVVPVHTSTPSDYELVSFRQCFAILGKHPIKLVAPAGLDVARYKEVVPQLDLVFIDPKWQSSLLGYNQLKTSRYFYNIFAQYEFILTYELDAFVFKDELDHWCRKGYDYIGAPWFVGFGTPAPGASLHGVGNSGFSLRRVSPIAKVLKEIYYKNPSEYQTDKKSLFKAYLKAPYRWFKNQLGENYTVQNSGLYEDRFFGEVVPIFSKTFVVAPIAEAIKFSFEVQPEILFQLNNEKLPMGCHAWWKYNFEFWKPFIKDFGYTL
ncbi:MAG: DUF5672 family protein [Janthinobacterium lividum]